MNPRYYKHSGNFEPVGLLLMMGFGVLGAVGGAFTYGYATHYIPLVIVTLLLTLGFGVVLGLLVEVGAKQGKVRNMPLLLAFSAFAGITAVYAQWVVFLHLKLDTGTWITSPGDILNIMQVMAAAGMWEVFDWTPEGGALYTIWGIEAAIIAGGAILVPWASLSDLPFCEQTGEWAEASEATAPMAVPDDLEGLARAIEADPAGTVRQIPRLEELEEVFLRATITYVADAPGTSYFLTVNVVTLSYDDDGDLTESTEEILQNLVVDQGTADALLDEAA